MIVESLIDKVREYEKNPINIGLALNIRSELKDYVAKSADSNENYKKALLVFDEPFDLINSEFSKYMLIRGQIYRAFKELSKHNFVKFEKFFGENLENHSDDEKLMAAVAKFHTLLDKADRKVTDILYTNDDVVDYYEFLKKEALHDFDRDDLYNTLN